MSRKFVGALLIAFVITLGIGVRPTQQLAAQGTAQSSVFGRGGIKALALSKDGKQLAVASTLGVWVYDATSLTTAK